MICWNLGEVQRASQIDVGSLKVGEPQDDAIFLAVHQTVPIARMMGASRGAVSATEQELLDKFCASGNVNQSHLIFVTGEVGTGKSHMVRWLRSSIGSRPDWHVVYVEKRETSLKRVIERIIDGIDTEHTARIRIALADASGDDTLEQAAFRLSTELLYIIRFELGATVDVIAPGGVTHHFDDRVTAHLRKLADRLLSERAVLEQLCAPSGAISRIASHAMPKGEEDIADEFNESELMWRDDDLEVDLATISDAGLGRDAVSDLGQLGRRETRKQLALLLNDILGRAKARSFTGRGTNLLELFEDVRREIARRGKSLCLFIEDLVLLNGIDRDLAQALTIPANADLCHVRAAIAVTSGYLKNLDTFTDRGIQFTMDVQSSTVKPSDKRDLVARYLNVGRVGAEALAVSRPGKPTELLINGCDTCAQRFSCHRLFGASSNGHGYYPFNAVALDRLIDLTSPGVLKPRAILREVVRGCLETANDELSRPGAFPSAKFGSNLDPNRQFLNVATQDRIGNESSDPIRETSLRNFYALNPNSDDQTLHDVADLWAIDLIALAPDSAKSNGPIQTPKPPRPELLKQAAFDNWALRNVRLPAPEANAVRGWIHSSLTFRLMNSAHGHYVRRHGNELHVGGVTVRRTDIVIENSAGGGGGGPGEVSLRIKHSPTSARLMAEIQRMSATGEVIPTHEQADLYFRLSALLEGFESEILAAAEKTLRGFSPDADLQILRMSNPKRGNGHLSPAVALQGLVAPMDRVMNSEQSYNRALKPLRTAALERLRDHYCQAKAQGKPSIIDIGAVYSDLKRVANIRSLSPEMKVAVPELITIEEAHGRLARERWIQLDTHVGLIRKVLTATDTLDVVIGEMGQLMQDANASGLLPRADSIRTYDDLAMTVRSEMQELCRLVENCTDEAVRTERVWDLPDDAQAQLSTLASWVTMCDELLSHIDQAASNSRTEREVDREAIAGALTRLASALAPLVKG